MYTTSVVKRVTKATSNQIQYWTKCGLLKPQLVDNELLFSFSELIKIKVIAKLRTKGLSLQKIKKGLHNLQNILDFRDVPISNLLIVTDGADMIVGEKGKYFSALTRQGYFSFDTEELNVAVIKICPNAIGNSAHFRKKNQKTA